MLCLQSRFLKEGAERAPSIEPRSQDDPLIAGIPGWTNVADLPHRINAMSSPGKGVDDGGGGGCDLRRTATDRGDTLSLDDDDDDDGCD